MPPFIFNSVNNICTVDDTWYKHASHGEFAGLPVKFISAEDLIWCKAYVQNRERYDGAVRRIKGMHNSGDWLDRALARLNAEYKVEKKSWDDALLSH